MDLLDKIGEVAEPGSGGTCFNAQFVANTLHELSDALCLWNASLEWAVSRFFARVAGSSCIKLHAGPSGALC
jgi:hypothetical protein